MSTGPPPPDATALPTLRLRRLGVDTHQEPVLYLRVSSPVCRAEGFDAQSRVLVRSGGRSIIATLNVVHDGFLESGEAGLSEAAWRLLEPGEGAMATFSHPPQVESLSQVRAKVYGHRLGGDDFHAIIQDVVAGLYADVHLAAFITACANDRLDEDEITGLTEAMVGAGKRLSWDRPMVVDKHCVGGLPGNRTTPIVVAIVTAMGLTMPKTSSRAITSPAGTADTMETLTNVTLTLPQVRRVVEKEGGCLAWGGGASLSPADDILIRVERALDLDSEGQLIASVLSKKVAAGATHVVLDIPVGPTAKVRSDGAAQRLKGLLETVGGRVGLTVEVLLSDGRAPVGRRIGPALEARDVLSVLRCDPGAPTDLRERSVRLAGTLLEIASAAPHGEGVAVAHQVLDDGRAWKKFQAICEAQGGLKDPPVAPLQHSVVSKVAGDVTAIDNRRLARVARFAGAPQAPAAGVELHVRLGGHVQKNQPLFTVHAETRGELEYALEYVSRHTDIFHVERRR